MTTLVLSDSQKWLVLKSLHELTSEEGIKKLHEEFPGMDYRSLDADIQKILDQVEAQKT